MQTNGLQWRDFVHIDDVCDAIIAAFDLAPSRTVQSGIEETLVFCMANREQLASLRL